MPPEAQQPQPLEERAKSHTEASEKPSGARGTIALAIVCAAILLGVIVFQIGNPFRSFWPSTPYSELLSRLHRRMSPDAVAEELSRFDKLDKSAWGEPLYRSQSVVDDTGDHTRQFVYMRPGCRISQQGMDNSQGQCSALEMLFDNDSRLDKWCYRNQCHRF